MHRETAALMEAPTSPMTIPAAFTRVDVHFNADAVLDAWSELERDAPCSIYQTRAWLLPWIQTLGRKAGIEPLFVLARGANDRAVGLLILGVTRRGPLRIATWLGGRDSNSNLPLLRSDVVWSSADLLNLLKAAARACGRRRPDLFYLVNQPFEWGGRANPLARLPHQVAPSAAYGTPLPTDASAFFAARLSKDTQKKLRKKEAKLAAFGTLTHLIAAADSRRQIIDSFLAHKVARFQAKKIISEFGTPEMRAFIETASSADPEGIELHALFAGDRVVAVYGGGAHGGHWSGMFNAFDADEEIAKCSPGDLLLMRIIAKACADGIKHFDLGIGEARYKMTFCDTRMELFDVIVPVTFTGRIAAGLFATRQMAKRVIKARPRLYALAKKMRDVRS